MLKTLAEIETYFKRIADESTELRGFVVGDTEQILSEDRSRLSYPMLWLETPDVTWELPNSGKRTYSLYFSILHNTRVDDWQHQQYVLHTCLEIVEDMLARIRDDHRLNLFKIVGQPQSDPIVGMGNDFDHGWRTHIMLEVPMKNCADCTFISPCPAYAAAKFTFENDKPGSFEELSIVQASNFAGESWTIEWSWSIDNGAVQTSATVPGPDLGTGSYLLLTMTMTMGACTLTASALIKNHKHCGESVPYLLLIQYC